MASETRREVMTLAAVSLFFLFSTQVLSFVSSTLASPDETANAFFAESLAQQGRLYSFEPLNTVLGDYFYPRSMVAAAGRLLPMSFLGLPLFFGGLLHLFGGWSLTFWTPLFALTAVWAWYAIFKKKFNHRLGFFSALLLLASPAWWYWSGRPLMHNVLFVSFLIFSVYFLVVRPTRGRSDFVLAGLVFGGALWTRTAEIFWLIPICLLVLLVFWKKISWSAVGLFLAATVATIIPLLFLNKSLYGDYLTTGYTIVSSPAASSIISPAPAASPVDQSWLIVVRDRLSIYFPFGLHPRAVLHNIWNYGLLMFWWLSLPVLVGAVLWRRRWRYLLGLFLATAILGVVYGSSAIHDNPDPAAVTIGNSYSRYWLPLFVAMTPLAAAALVRLGEKTKPFVPAICLIALFAFGADVVFFSSDDALWPMRGRLAAAETIRATVLDLTEDDAVIVTERGDKLFFPDRIIRYPLRDETTYALLPKIVEFAPLYYYGITLPQSDLDYLNNLKLKDDGLRIELVKNFGVESLYRFIIVGR